MGKAERRLSRRQKAAGVTAAAAAGRTTAEPPKRSPERTSLAWRGLERLAAQHDLPKWVREDQVPRSSCGHCGQEMDAATHGDGFHPEPGEFSVCWCCAGVNRFGPALELVKVTEAEFEALTEDEVDLSALQEARALIRAAMMGAVRKGAEA